MSQDDYVTFGEKHEGEGPCIQNFLLRQCVKS